MSLVQTYDRALVSKIGEGGIDDAAFHAKLEQSREALDWVRSAHANKELALLGYAGKTDDLPGIQSAAKTFAEGATDLIFYGTGGSSLGAQALAQLADYNVPALGVLRDGPRLHFLDNLDPITLDRLFAKLPLETSRFMAVSKSGGTGETLVQVMATISLLQAKGHGDHLARHFLGLSEPPVAGKTNELRALLEPYGVSFLDHDTGVGGRYSVATNVGLLPAATAGLDIAAVRNGFMDALKPILDGAEPKDVPAAIGATLAACAADADKNVSVMMSYADRLERTAAWWVQLWSESLGKDGKGTTPVRALGPVDQHSQLQLHLGGPRDKLFTIVTVGFAGKGPKLDPALAERVGEPVFANKTVGDFAAAEGRATADTLARNGRPTRTIHIPELNEHTLGTFLMQFMLETIITARLIGVNAFDQPAVEEGKILAKKYLGEG